MYCIVCVCSGKRVAPDQFALEYMLASFDISEGIFIPHSHYMSVNVARLLHYIEIWTIGCRPL